MTIKKSVKAILTFVAVVLLALAVRAGISPPVSVAANAASSAYDFTIQGYAVDMKVATDGTIEVEEEIEVFFTGSSSHGIIRDFPLGNGVRYVGIEAKCKNSSDFYSYTATDDTSFLSLYLRGDAVVTGQTRVYTITYTMEVPSAKEEGYLPLDVIGFGWGAQIENVRATVTIPDGLQEWKIYSGSYGTSGNVRNAVVSQNGNVISIVCDLLGKEQGITLDLKFEEGVIVGKFDASVLWAVLIGVVLIGVAVVLKLLVFRQPVLSPTVNLTAPDEMDPLKMGKLIDNSVDGEDLGALIFWLADQGYLKIDLSEGEKDPVLIATGKKLPPDAPPHQRAMYDGLFAHGDRVKVSSLKNRFYKTAETIKTTVNAASVGMYRKSSVAGIVLYGIISALLLGGFAMLYAFRSIGGYVYWYLLAGCAVAYAATAFVSSLVSQRALKWKRAACAALSAGAVVATCLIGALALLFLPCPAFGWGTGFLLILSAALTGAVGGFFLCRTEEFTAKLGHIVGFKNFILFTEKDKIKFMLQENPETYYRILPYAQVLGVTNEWTDKFKGLEMNPPSYVAYNTADFIWDCMVWNALFRSLNTNFSTTMVSRPSSSGGGSISGGFGGGFGGGGFGGGGGRGC